MEKKIKTIEWAAGLFEGEGSIYKDKSRPMQRHISLRMCDLDVLQDYVDIVGGNITGPYRKRSHPHHKPYYSWIMRKKTEVIRVLHLLSPYLGERRLEKATEALNHLTAQL